MNRAFSIYLDLVRFGAACLVYLYHSNQRWLVADVLPFAHYGHSSVIVFFVLSGFVIAYITDTKERDWISYSASRLSRVYSVVLPALALTLVLDTVGRQLLPAAYGGYPYDQLAVRSLASLLMLNELWFVSITSLSNVPYWSITYELWYYVLFGLVMFLPPRLAIVAVLAMAALLGPKILLLAPIWWAGVLLYRWRRLDTMPLALAWALVFGSLVLIVGLHAIGWFDAVTAWFKAWLGADRHTQLTFSKFFVGDYVLGVLVFSNFAGMRRVAPQLGAWLLRVERPVRWVAGYTFSLYLLHQPLFLFWGAVLRGDNSGKGFWWCVTLLTALSVVGIGYLTENKRHLLKAAIARRLAGLQDLMRRRQREAGAQ
ncbi:acyltransferase family protein [Aquabacterium sp.]|uniref:acyltransferase family protein n=1 Tax=Aquabacterium sp. TaxID=1872578 RepID=UPI002CDF325F|nr:acyltransferase [Aquabacterium sp.]HSW08973.1 acyltransferase [Aquabacterium sp.]